MTKAMQQRIQDLCVQYGTGRDTLRCLALGTIDHPISPNQVCFTGLWGREVEVFQWFSSNEAGKNRKLRRNIKKWLYR